MAMEEEKAAKPEGLVIPADPAFFTTSVCGTPLIVRAIYSLAQSTDKVHVLRTAACPVSAEEDLECEISHRELQPRIEWVDSAEGIPTANGLLIVARPGVFDSRLCAELSAAADGEGTIIRCRRPGEEAPLWYAGRGEADRLIRYLASHSDMSMTSDSELSAIMRDHHPNGAVCEIISDDRSRRMVEKRLFKQAGKANDSLVAKLDRNVSGWVTRHLVRSSITPNQMTLVSSLIGICGAALMLAGTYAAQVIGAALLVLCVILDGCDGELARLKFLESSFGRKLDFFLDNVVNTLAIFAAGAGHYFQTGQKLYLILGAYTAALAAASVWPVYQLFFREKQKAVGTPRGPADAYSVAEGLQGRDFVYLILFLALIGKTYWFTLVAAVGLTFFVPFMMVLWVRRLGGQTHPAIG